MFGFSAAIWPNDARQIDVVFVKEACGVALRVCGARFAIACIVTGGGGVSGITKSGPSRVGHLGLIPNYVITEPGG